jgi:hypothetical protein
MDIKKTNKEGKTLIERSADAYERYIQARDSGDFKKAQKLSDFIEWCNDRIRKGKEK